MGWKYKLQRIKMCDASPLPPTALTQTIQASDVPRRSPPPVWPLRTPAMQKPSLQPFSLEAWRQRESLTDSYASIMTPGPVCASCFYIWVISTSLSLLTLLTDLIPSVINVSFSTGAILYKTWIKWVIMKEPSAVCTRKSTFALLNTVLVSFPGK